MEPPEEPETSGSAKAENSVDLLEALRRLTAPFFEQGGPVFVTYCCNFLYAGTRAADVCGTCKKAVVCAEVKTEAEALDWLQKSGRTG